MVECTYFYRITEATEYSDYLMGGEQWISLTGFSPTLKVWSQKPPETVLEIKKLKSFLGEHMPLVPLV